MTEQGRHAVYTEPAREVPILADVEVLVVGGGPAGVAAAIGAARTGASVFLAEERLGARLVDTVLVTENGAERLSTASRDLIVAE